MGLRDFTLNDVIERNARLHGDRTAFATERARVTHREYALCVEAIAAGFAGSGLVAGDRVAVLAQNCLEYVEIYGAAARLGLIVVAVNWRLGAEEIGYVITDTTPRAIVVDAEYQAMVESLRDRLHFVEHYFSLGEAQGVFASYQSLAQSGAAPVPPPAELAVGSGFVIIHTAAVSGQPRGALLTHGGLVAASLQYSAALNLSADDVHLGVLPLFHLFGLGLMLAVQHVGGATAILPRFDPQTALSVIRDERVTVFTEFPPMLGNLLDQAAADGIELASLRHVLGIDTAENVARLESAVASARFWSLYGQSEVSGPVSLAPFRDKPGSAGRLSSCNSVGIVDDSDQPLPVGATGEIVVRGPMVFNGYWNRPDDNDFTFRNGWHHTGDMGRVDADGYLWYCGRSPAKELIKSGGENVYPAEVEGALLKHPAVAEAVVFGFPDSHWGEAIKAVCVCHPGQIVGAGELIEFVGGKIARFKRPKHVEFCDALPKDPQGAHDRARIKREFSGS